MLIINKNLTSPAIPLLNCFIFYKTIQIINKHQVWSVSNLIKIIILLNILKVHGTYVWLEERLKRVNEKMELFPFFHFYNTFYLTTHNHTHNHTQYRIYHITDHSPHTSSHPLHHNLFQTCILLQSHILLQNQC